MKKKTRQALIEGDWSLTKKRKKSQQDATLRNVKAANKRLARLEKQIEWLFDISISGTWKASATYQISMKNNMKEALEKQWKEIK